MDQREIEEILELIWTKREEGIFSRRMILDLTNEKNPEKLLSAMATKKLILDDKDDVLLTPEGEKYAKIIVRRHRLAERLFKDVFHMDEETLEKEACTWEHILSEDVTDNVCSFLGHPRVCPHNKPIPPGECCFKFKHEKRLEPLVQPLSGVDVGVHVKILYILPSLKKRLESLTNFGIIPGTTLYVKQKYPALVVVSNETTIALDKEVGSEIYVNLINGR